MFGASGLAKLLDSNALSIQLVPHVIAESSRAMSPKPPASVFSFCYVTADDRRTHEENLMAGALPKISGLVGHEREMLEDALRRAVVDIPSEVGREALTALQRVIMNERPILAKALQLVSGHRPPPGSRFDARILQKSFFWIDPSWMKNLAPDKKRNLIQDTLFAAANLCLRKEKMRLHNALVGFREKDLPLLEEDLRFLRALFDADGQIETLQRVLRISGAPDVEEHLTDHFIDVDALIDVRAARETADFRAWLWKSHNASDGEIEERVRGIRNRIGRFLGSTTGKGLRWLAGVGIGAVPGLGAIAGATLGAADTFLLEKILPDSGVMTFIGDLYPSIFRRASPDLARPPTRA